MDEIKITPMDETHVEGVYEVECLSFRTPWSKEAFYSELWENSYAHYLVAVTDERVVGYAGMWMILDEAHVTNIAVHPDYRERKIGERLLAALIELAVRLGATKMTLEVRRSNLAAQNLYAKFDFIPCGIRKGYYTDTKEDAIIMWKDPLF